MCLQTVSQCVLLISTNKHHLTPHVHITTYMFIFLFYTLEAQNIQAILVVLVLCFQTISSSTTKQTYIKYFSKHKPTKHYNTNYTIYINIKT